MDFLARMNGVADYIEAHLTEEIDCAEVARIVCCGVHQFGRIFSYIVGMSLTEYVRRRRLSQAALELQAGDRRVIDVALRYGYTSPDAFARAFVALHGITPSGACVPGATLRMCPRIAFKISIKGGADMDLAYRIERHGPVSCVGIVRNFGRVVVDESASHWTQERPDIWRYWDAFLDHGENIILRDKYALYRAPFYQVGMDWTMENGDTIVHIGAQARDGEAYPELTPFVIPARTWAVFTCRGTLNQNVHPVTRMHARVLSEWLPVSGYEIEAGLTLETYGPGDTQKDDYVCALWLPVHTRKGARG